MKNEVVILYASCGEGHKKAACALSYSLNCGTFDILDFSPPIVKSIYSLGYRFVVKKASYLWAILFEISKFFIFRKILFLFHIVIFRSFLKFLLIVRPKIVISTHFFCSPLVSLYKDRLDLKNLVLITDLGVHPLWIDKGVDTYFVGLEETRLNLIKKGIPQDKIVVSGIPLREGFWRKPKPSLLRERFSLEDKPSLLFFSSDMGNIPFLKKAIDDLIGDFNLFVIYGRDKKLREFFRHKVIPSLKAFPYYENIWEIMNLALAIITKPGGLTVFEALILKKPLLFTHYIWGQEKANMEIVTKLGVGFFTRDYQALKKKIYYLKDNPQAIESKSPSSLKDANKVLKEYLAKLKSGNW
jgi:processive 1,2-diacylglycerol beta-glucosyltransferase